MVSSSAGGRLQSPDVQEDFSTNVVFFFFYYLIDSGPDRTLDLAHRVESNHGCRRKTWSASNFLLPASWWLVTIGEPFQTNTSRPSDKNDGFVEATFTAILQYSAAGAWEEIKDREGKKMDERLIRSLNSWRLSAEKFPLAHFYHLFYFRE